MVLTDDEALAARARSIGNHGRPIDRKLPSERVGHNYRMSEFQAALGLWAVDRIEEGMARRHALGQRNYTCSRRRLGCRCICLTLSR